MRVLRESPVGEASRHSRSREQQKQTAGIPMGLATCRIAASIETGMLII